ncbi:MAG: tetratricopeptide repeat protein [Gemmatimonadota bacterium]|nr:MAG: tetratricopeptide repeat protein [Gemmatimonadota bacterium]
MKRATRTLVAAMPLLLLVGCQQQEAERMEMAAADVVMVIPVTTASDEAMQEFMQGQHAFDVERGLDANEHFKRAIEIDPNFCMAYLSAAWSAPSLDEFRTNLQLAVEHSAGASEAERLLVEYTQKSFDRDREGQLQTAQRLVEVEPSSPRAWLTLSEIQATLNQTSEARASLTRALELEPEFVPAHIALVNSYLFVEPKDYSTAEEHAQRVVQAEPDETVSHDYLGDVYRAQNELEQARDAYTRAAELDPEDGLPIQQRGHVHTFLGDYDAARADYDAAIALGKGNEKASYGQYRAMVSVYAGEPEAAIGEFMELARAIDDMDIPNAIGQKITALTNAAVVAMEYRLFPEMDAALEQRTALMMERMEEVGTDEFRRGQLGNIALFDGWTAAFKGDYATALAKVEEYRGFVEQDRNPRKDEPAQLLLGMIEQLQGNHQEALAYFEQVPPDDPYFNYQRAVALEAVGETERAMEIYEELARYNFSNVNYALVRADAIAKVSM